MQAAANEAAAYLQKQGFLKPETAVVLGTGLGQAFVHSLEVIASVHYRNIPNFPSSTVQSHRGQLICGRLNGKTVLVMQGRVHYYEGYGMGQVTFPVEVMKELGVKNLIVTNAAGNLNMKWHKGDIMLIQDHINYQPANPLRGKKMSEKKLRDLSNPYSSAMIKAAKSIASKKKIQLREGVYVSVAGPSLETRSEYKYFRFIGGDVVGMSTVPEVLMAKALGMEVCGFSILTNDCDPDNLHAVALSEIVDTAAEAEGRLTQLISELIKKIN
jgi:purine-nucleoside phosphorylase